MSRQFNRIKAAFCGGCAYCGGPGPLTRDHVVPKSKGGRHGYWNIVPACEPCNRDKDSRNVVEWIIASKKNINKLIYRWIRAIDYIAPRVEAAARQERKTKNRWRGKGRKLSFADWTKMLQGVIIKLENTVLKEEK